MKRLGQAKKIPSQGHSFQVKVNRSVNYRRSCVPSVRQNRINDVTSLLHVGHVLEVVYGCLRSYKMFRYPFHM